MRPYYEQDGITIYHGDCREVVPLLHVDFDVVIADPPYGQTSLKWDRWPNDWPITTGLGASLWCFGSLRLFLEHAHEFERAYWTISQDVVWEKHNGSGFAADRFKRVHDQAVHFYRGPWANLYHEVPRVKRSGPRKTVRQRGQTPHTGAIGNTGYIDDGFRLTRSVIYAPSMQGSAENETEKPEAIVGPLIEYACPHGGLVLSPFAGSGTELITARILGRRAIGVELREEQCEISAKRLAQGVLDLQEPA